MSHPAYDFALAIVRRLQQAGHIAYFAGGCVRDRLMGREPKDFDVATSAHPEQVLGLFPRGQLVGAAFGVIIIRERKIQIEVATFRTEGAYSDGRRPDSVAFTTPEIDARRRDFTCNAIFHDPVADVLHDFVNGRADIEAKLLRAVGDPAHRFAEDHLRMLRAMRFAAKLDFGIEPATFAAIRANAGKIKEISRERVGEELRMMLEHPARVAAVKLLVEAGLLVEIWPPELLDTGAGDFAFLHAPGAFTRASGIVAMQLGMFPPPIPAPPCDHDEAAELLKAAFVLSNDEAADIAWLLNQSDAVPTLGEAPRARFKRLLADRRWPVLWQLFRPRVPGEFADKVESRIAMMQAEGVAPTPFVTGENLIALGAAPGKKFKGWLETLYDRQLELEFPTHDAAISAAKQLIAQG